MIELRLDGTDPDRIDSLVQGPPVGPVRHVARRPMRRSAVLLDTSDWALARARMALELHVRPRQGELVALWDAAGAGEVPARRELRQALARTPAMPARRLPDGPVAERVRAIVAGRPLQAALSASVVRRRMDFLVPAAGPAARGATVRGLVDTLLVGTADGAPPTRFVELTLIAPAFAAAETQRLASVLSRRFGLVPSRLPRMLGALMLVHGDVPFLNRTAGPVATADALGIATRKVLGHHLRRLQEHDPGTRSGGDPEDLHDMRVATRRLRAALRVFAPALAPALAQRFTSGLRRLGRLLGSVRDLDVQLERAGSAPVEYRRFLEAKRDTARGRALRGLDGPGYLRLVADLDRFSCGTATGRAPAEALDPVGPHAAAAIDGAFRRLRRAARRAVERPGATVLHEVRIRAKRLRYALEFFETAAGTDAARLVERLTEIQDLLGAHQDAVVAARLARAWGREGGGADAVAARIAEERGIAQACRDRFARVWEKFERRETRRRVERVILRLDPERGPKKKGDAASGVP